jgi:hypothetical protein
VADRWHLLKNLADVIQAIIERLQRKKKRALLQDTSPIIEEPISSTVVPNFDLPQWQWEESLQAIGQMLNKQALRCRLLPHLPSSFSAPAASQSNSPSAKRPPEKTAYSFADQYPILSKTDSRTLIKLCFREARLSEKERKLISDVRAESEEFDRTFNLAKEFVRIIRGQSEWKLSQWIVRANETGIRELRSFANGLQQDYVAVKEATTSAWSNGQTEGQVNRLKLIKRSMYGRAKFDLLRARVLHRV